MNIRSFKFIIPFRSSRSGRTPACNLGTWLETMMLAFSHLPRPQNSTSSKQDHYPATKTGGSCHPLDTSQGK